MATSFICEHTAEYFLTRRIADALLPWFDFAVPIHYWATREGSSIAMQSIADTPIRVVAVYARRPKITAPGADRLVMKINEQLFAAATFAARFGIPLLAGLPLVTQLADLCPEAGCAWFWLTGGTGPGCDVEIVLPVDDPHATVIEDPHIVGPVLEDSLADRVQYLAGTWHWRDATRIMHALRNKGMGHHGPFGGGYQPFYVVLPGDTTQCRSLEADFEAV